MKATGERAPSNDRSWPSAEKIEAKFYTHRILAYWPEPEPTLTGWFISALDPMQNKPKMCQHGYRVDLARSKRSLGLLRGLEEQYGIEAR